VVLMLKTKVRRTHLEWRALTAHAAPYHFIVAPKGERWVWRVKADYGGLGEPLFTDSSKVKPGGYSTSAEARIGASVWLHRKEETL
jgi:hypothetical protein